MPEETKFEELSVGETFLLNGYFFVKTPPIYDGKKLNFDAFCPNKKSFVSIEGSTEVDDLNKDVETLIEEWMF